MSGSRPGSSAPCWASAAPVTTTARPPSPISTSSIACWRVSSRKKGRRSEMWRCESWSSLVPREASCWKATISPRPWTESTAKAPSSPAASRAWLPSWSTRFRIRNGLSPAASRNGSSATASQPLAQARTATTAAGTRMATKAGATVWAKKYSTSSMSWVASAIRSPVRRRTR